MSYRMASRHHSKGSAAYAPRRSNATTVRSPAGAGSGRPRSLNFYGPSAATTSSFGGLLGVHAGVGGYGSDTSYHGGHGGYASPHSYGSPSSLSTYGGTTSGYGGLTLHHASSSSSSPSSGLGLSASPSCSVYYNSLLQTPVNHIHNSGSGSSSSSRTPSRTNSFNRGLTSSRNSPLSSSLGSRSGSLTSLASSTCSGSEGYAVSQHQYKKNNCKMYNNKLVCASVLTTDRIGQRQACQISVLFWSQKCCGGVHRYPLPYHLHHIALRCVLILSFRLHLCLPSFTNLNFVCRSFFFLHPSLSFSRPSCVW